MCIKEHKKYTIFKFSKVLPRLDTIFMFSKRALNSMLVLFIYVTTFIYIRKYTR